MALDTLGDVLLLSIANPGGPSGHDPRFCPRCGYVGERVMPWRGWPYARGALFTVLGVLLVLSPIISVDYMVMIPSSLAVAFATGPVLAFSAVPPTCRKCGYAFRQPPGRFERALRFFAKRLSPAKPAAAPAAEEKTRSLPR